MIHVRTGAGENQPSVPCSPVAIVTSSSLPRAVSVDSVSRPLSPCPERSHRQRWIPPVNPPFLCFTHSPPPYTRGRESSSPMKGPARDAMQSYFSNRIRLRRRRVLRSFRLRHVSERLARRWLLPREVKADVAEPRDDDEDADDDPHDGPSTQPRGRRGWRGFDGLFELRGIELHQRWGRGRGRRRGF